MALYSLSLRNEIQLAVGTPVVEFIAAPTEQLAIVELSMSIFTAANAANAVGLGAPAAAGVSPVDNGYRFSAEGLDAFVPTSKIATRWGTAPTVPAKFFRRGNLGSGINGGYSLMWKFGDGLSIAPASTVILWCIAGNGAANTPVFLDINAVVNL